MSSNCNSAHLEFVLGTRINLAKHKEYSERWVEELIKKHPSILGLGDKLEYVSSQVRNSNRGRLDLVLKDDEVVYSVELMLGQLDESHIIRTLDYWLRNQTRPNFHNYEHVAVLVAEGVLSCRFAEVVKFLSPKVNLIVIELAAIKVRYCVTLHCTTIFDGSVAIEDDVEQEEGGSLNDWPADKLQLIEEVLKLARPALTDAVAPQPRKESLGIRVGNKVNNFIVFTPKTDFIRVAVYVKDPEQWAAKLEQAGIDVLRSLQGSRVRFRLTPDVLGAKRELLKELCQESATSWFAS